MEEEKKKLTAKQISVMGAKLAEKLAKKTDGQEEAFKVLEVARALLSRGGYPEK